MKLNCIVVDRHPAPDARSVAGTVTVQPTITILDSTLRIIGVDFTKLDLGEDYPGQPVKKLFDALTREGRYLDSSRDIGLCGPAGGFFEANLVAFGGRSRGHFVPCNTSEIAARANGASSSSSSTTSSWSIIYK